MLNKINRLAKTYDFQRAYKHGTYVVARQMVIYYFRTTAADDLRVGFVASKKVGKSHVRVRCKRLMREAMRRLLPSLAAGYDLVIVARPPLAQEEFGGVYQIMAKLLRKARLIGEGGQ